MAESLIVPVRMGIARPTAPFTLASTSIDAVQGSEELFSVEPLPPRPSPDQSSRWVDFLGLGFPFWLVGYGKFGLVCLVMCSVRRAYTYTATQNFGIKEKCPCF